MLCVPHVDSCISDSVKLGVINSQFYMFSKLCSSEECFLPWILSSISLLKRKGYSSMFPSKTNQNFPLKRNCSVFGISTFGIFQGFLTLSNELFKAHSILNRSCSLKFSMSFLSSLIFSCLLLFFRFLFLLGFHGCLFLMFCQASQHHGWAIPLISVLEQKTQFVGLYMTLACTYPGPDGGSGHVMVACHIFGCYGTCEYLSLCCFSNCPSVLFCFLFVFQSQLLFS